jgi:hypothetical protein
MRSVMYGAIQDVQEGVDPIHVIRDPDANHLAHIVARDAVVPKTEDWRAVLEK